MSQPMPRRQEATDAQLRYAWARYFAARDHIAMLFMAIADFEAEVHAHNGRLPTKRAVALWQEVSDVLDAAAFDTHKRSEIPLLCARLPAACDREHPHD